MATVENEHFSLQHFICVNLNQVFPINQRKYLISQETPSEFKKKKNYFIFDIGIREITKITNKGIESKPIIAIEICNDNNQDALLKRIPSIFEKYNSLKELFVYNYIKKEMILYTPQGGKIKSEQTFKSEILNYSIKEPIDYYYFFLFVIL